MRELGDLAGVLGPPLLALAVAWLARQDRQRAADLKQLRLTTGKERRSRQRAMHGRRRRRR